MGADWEAAEGGDGVERARAAEAEESMEVGGAAAADDRRAEHSDDEEEEEETAPAAKKKKGKKRCKRANQRIRIRAKKRESSISKGGEGDPVPKTQDDRIARH